MEYTPEQPYFLSFAPGQLAAEDDPQRAIYEAMAEQARRRGDLVGEALALCNLAAHVAPERALALAKRAQGLFSRAGHNEGMVVALGAEGEAHARAGDLDLALARRREAVDLAVRLRVPAEEFDQLAGLALLHDQRQEVDEAVACCRRALALLDRLPGLPAAERLERRATLLSAAGQTRARKDPAAAIGDLQAAIACYRELKDEERVASAATQLGTALAEAGRLPEAIAAFAEAAAWARDAFHEEGMRLTLKSLTELHVRQGDYPRAIACMEELRQLAVDLEDRPEEREALHTLGTLYYHAGDLPRSRDAHERALHLSRMLGERQHEVKALCELAAVCRGLKDLAGAARHLEQALPIQEELGLSEWRVTTLANLGTNLSGLGRYQAAIAPLEEAFRALRAQEDWLHLAMVGDELGRCRARAGQATRAVEVLEEALAASRKVPDRPPDLEMQILENLGEAHVARGDHRSGAARFEEMLAQARAVGRRAAELLALHQAAGCAFYLKQYRKALRYSEEELALARAAEDREQEADALYAMGVTEGELGNRTRAVALVQAAQAIWAELGSPEVSLAREALQAWGCEN
jgi:tetratricopeptide (TPR) repeat protein